MPVKWKIFRVVCIVQMLGSSILGILALINLLRDFSVGGIMKVALYVFIFLLTILALNITNNNYPDTPVAGTQKTNFNRLFLINFLFLVFLFGIIFAEIREIHGIASILAAGFFDLPSELYTHLFINFVMLLLQFYLLYGLYELRRELYINFTKKQFDFEKEK